VPCEDHTEVAEIGIVPPSPLMYHCFEKVPVTTVVVLRTVTVQLELLFE